MEPFALTQTNYDPQNFFPRINREYRDYVRRGLVLDDMRDEDKFSMSDYLELRSANEPFDDFSKLEFTTKVRRPVKNGEKFHFSSILSSRGVKHLIRCVPRSVDGDYNNDCDFVNVGLKECFQGKTLVLFVCASVPVKWCEKSAHKLCQLSIISSELSASHSDFEMVFVPKMRKMDHDSGYYGQDDFQHFFSAFPHRLAVPLSSQSACDFICQKVGFRGELEALLVSGDHEVLLQDVIYNIFPFGSDGFPFTDDRLELLETELPRLSLAGLLGLHPSSHLTKFGSSSETISIEQLSHKVVGLYMFHRGDKLRVFNEVYQQLRAADATNGIETRFEIVLVFFPPLTSIHPLVFEHEASTVLNDLHHGRSWWTLAYNNSTCLRLWQLIEEHRRDAMVVVDPVFGSVDPYGGDILACFGEDAYPFTRESLVRTYVEKAERVILHSLLSCPSVDYVVGPDDQHISLTELVGKKVILCVERAQVSEHTHTFLRSWYEQIKLHHSESDLKVVYVLCKDPGDGPTAVRERQFGGTEWLEYPCNSVHSAFLKNHEAFFRAVVGNTLLTGLRPPLVLAFGGDGRIQLLNARYHVNLHGFEADPFLPQYKNLRYEVICGMRSYLEFMCGYE